MDDDIVAACLMTRDGEVRAREPRRSDRGNDHGHRRPTITNLIIFVLAIYVGYHVVWTVTPALHTPLMAVTNAISAIVIVGAMLAAALTETGLRQGAWACSRVALAAVNIFGGFLVTRRMLEMFKKSRRRRLRGEGMMRGDFSPGVTCPQACKRNGLGAKAP